MSLGGECEERGQREREGEERKEEGFNTSKSPTRFRDPVG